MKYQINASNKAMNKRNQLALNIETFSEARDKGLFVPKPQWRNVHKSLREIRRLVRKSREYGLLNSSDVIRLVNELAIFLRSSGQKEIKAELKKFLYASIRDKAYAETIDDEFNVLLSLCLELSLEPNKKRYAGAYSTASPKDIFFALGEIFNDLFPTSADDSAPLRQPELEADIREKYPHFFKLMFGENYSPFLTIQEEEAYARKKLREPRQWRGL
jgi:hypothetical protein